MGVITPNAGLILTAVILGIFSVFMTVAPKWMMDQYSVDSSKWSQLEKLMVLGVFQFIGLQYGLGVAACNVTFRNGTDDQKSMLCAVTGVSFIVNGIVAFSSTGSLSDLGIPASGGYFNGVLCLVVAIVNFLGYSKAEIKLVNLKAPIFWGFLGSIVIYTLYMFGFAFAAESLSKSYGVELSGNANGVLMNLMKFNIAPWYLYIIGIFILQICVPGPLSTYVYARYVGFFNMALFIVYLITANIWTNLDVQATGFTSSVRDKIVSGQYFNAALYFFFFVLFYVAVVRIDGSLKEAVEKELAAPAKKAKKSKAVAEPAAAPAAAGEPVVEPLLPPPRPLMPLASSSTLIPSYSMVAAPQMAYGSQPQYYAAPATTAYAAPATTAYATPMPQYTYATAAPATAGYAPVATTAYAAPVTVATTA